MFDDKSILITGGTGSFGKAFSKTILDKFNPRRLVIFSRDEMKQWNMADKFRAYDRDKKIDIREYACLRSLKTQKPRRVDAPPPLPAPEGARRD